MPHVVTSFSYPVEKVNLIKDIEKLAQREEITLSKLIIKLLEDYHKVHKSGNPQHMMDAFLENEDFTGFPAMAIDLTAKKKYVHDVLSKNSKMTQDLFYHIQEWFELVKKL